VTALFFAEILVGIATTMLGALMPGFEARWSLDDAQGGLLFVAQFLTSVIAAALVGVLARRFGYWRLCAASLFVIAVGVAGCATRSWTVTLVSVGVCGFGLGAFIPAANFAIASETQGGSSRRILWLNVFWSMGAVAAPLLVAWLSGAFLPTIAAACGVMALWVAIGGAGRPSMPMPLSRDAAPPHWLFALMLFLYVGAESAIAGWVSSFATRSPGAERLWAVLPSVFWGAILTGRLIAPNILHRIRPAVLAQWSLAVSLGGAVLLLTWTGPLGMVVGTAISGLGFAPMFPLVVAAYADRTGGRAISGLVFCAAGLGGAAIPPLVGFVSTASGSLRLGLATVLALILAMIRLTRTVMPRSDRSA
jgi:MFS transporter, FHS family, glucose/mannose:H+ symporter